MVSRSVVGIFVVALMITSCGGSGDSDSPTVQLEKLRAERARIDQEISKLEATLVAAEPSSSGIPVTTMMTQEAPFRHTINVQGIVDSRTTISVAPQMAGRIVALSVTNGSVVKKGQILFELDADLLRSSIAEVQTQLEFATTLFKKQERIFEQKAGSEVQYLQAKANKEALDRRLDALQEQLRLMRVTAPTSGYVDNLTLSVGEMAMPGMPVLTIVNTSDMHVEVDMAEAYLNSVSRGDSVVIRVPDLQYEYRTTIGTVARTLNTVSRTFKVEIPLARIPVRLLPNTTAVVEIVDQIIPAAISIPMTAVLQTDGAAFVYVVGKNNIAEKRPVKLGLVVGANVQIASGLQPQEQIVVRGNRDVGQGQRVRIINPS